MKKLAMLLLASMMAVPCAVAAEPNTKGMSGQALVEEAQKEGKLVFYGNITGIEPIMEAFTQEYHIDGKYTRVSTSKFLSTVLAGHQSDRLSADVLQAPVPILHALKKKGLLAPCNSHRGADYPDWTRVDDSIQLFGIEEVALIYNKDRVQRGDVPNRYSDLTNPKWQDKIVMPDPSTHATTISWLVALKEQVFSSEEAWMKFLQGLAKNRPTFVASFGPTPAPIERGEKWIGISLPKYIVTRAPSPLGWAPKEDPLFGTPRGIAIAASAPHPQAARLFVDYWLSGKAMKLLAEKAGEFVLTPDIYPPIPGIELEGVLPIRELSEEELQKWGAVFKKIFNPPGPSKS